MDIQKQIAYWRDGSVSNLESAEVLFAKGKRWEGLFFCHLALEKILKALIVKKTLSYPPRIHHLLRLKDLAALHLERGALETLAEMNDFAFEGRYPLPSQSLPSETEGQRLLRQTQETHQWLMKKL